MCGSSGAWGNSPSPRSLNSKPMPDSSPLPFQRMNSITTGFLRAFLTSSSRVMASPARPCRPPSNVDRDLLRLTSAESPPHNSGKLNRFPQLGDTSAKYPALPPCCQVSQPIQYIFVPATPPLGSWLRRLGLAKQVNLQQAFFGRFTVRPNCHNFTIHFHQPTTAELFNVSVHGSALSLSNFIRISSSKAFHNSAVFSSCIACSRQESKISLISSNVIFHSPLISVLGRMT